MCGNEIAEATVVAFNSFDFDFVWGLDKLISW